MEQIDLKNRHRRKTDVNSFNPDKLALVHVTDYMPQKKDGHWEIQSTAEATDYLFVRNTVHFTVGHHVESHFFGNWVKNGVMIATPLMGVIRENNKPLGMSGVDTWFETTPGHNLKLPMGTQVFAPAENPDDLKGELFKTKGDITYYKASQYTPEEKEKIFNRITHPYFDGDCIPDPYGGYNSKYYTDRKPFYYTPAEWGIDDYSVTELTLETAQNLPDSFFALQMKKILLSNWIEENEYLSDTRWRFSGNSEEIEKLGEKLGCRFCSSSNDNHHWGNFENEHLMDEMSRKLQALDFIFHSDQFELQNRNDDGEYIFHKPGSKTETFQMSQAELDEFVDGKEIIDALEDVKNKESIDYFAERLKEMGKKANASSSYGYDDEKERFAWTDAFKATYDVWTKKTVERLHQYHKMAKGFDLDTWKQQLNNRMREYDKNNGGLLTRSFARPAKGKTSEERKTREKKATKLLKILRERDDSGRGKTLRAFLKEKTEKKVSKEETTKRSVKKTSRI